jgi:nucleotide-binding universal stress UspA family protein
MPMRVLIAYDGSAGSSAGAELVRSMPWPRDTVLHVLSVVDPGAWIPPADDVPSPTGLVDEREVAAYYQGHQGEVLTALTEAGLHAKGSVVSGRPAETIVEQATSRGADVVIIGSRGHGHLAALLLGSVSAEVVDQAPCPVLVARTPLFTRAVLAVDGSLAARAAANVAASWPVFAAVPIETVAVAEAVRPWTVGIAPAFVTHAMKTYARDLEDATGRAHALAEEAAAGLREAQRDAQPAVRTGGEVAVEIIKAATESGAELIVIGTRGRTGFPRVLLGSVARDVLLASPTSVLMVRESTRG